MSLATITCTTFFNQFYLRCKRLCLTDSVPYHHFRSDKFGVENPVSYMALTTTTSAKLHLGVTTNAEDPFFTAIVPQVDAMIKRWLNQDIEQQTLTEYYEGNNSPNLVLLQGPIISITSIYLDAKGAYGFGSDPFPSETLLTAGTDYAWRRNRPRSRIVMRLNGTWPAIYRRSVGLLSAYQDHGLGNIKITYVAGYATVPADLALAANIIVGLIRHDAMQGGATLTSESYEGYSYSVQREMSYLKSVQYLLKNYRVLRR